MNNFAFCISVYRCNIRIAARYYCIVSIDMSTVNCRYKEEKNKSSSRITIAPTSHQRYTCNSCFKSIHPDDGIINSNNDDDDGGDDGDSNTLVASLLNILFVQKFMCVFT